MIIGVVLLKSLEFLNERKPHYQSNYFDAAATNLSLHPMRILAAVAGESSRNTSFSSPPACALAAPMASLIA